MFRHFFCSSKTTYQTFSTLSSSIRLGVTMKNLIGAKEYRKALDLFQKHPEPRTDILINLALKACTNLGDYQSGIRIQQQLSSHSLDNHYIQTSLIHFYMQCHDIDSANRLFSTIVTKTNAMYGAMCKGFISNMMPEKVLDLLDDTTIELDQFIYALIFNACAQLNNDRAREFGNKFLHKMPNHIQNNNIVLTSAIHMLMMFGDVTRAERIFQLIKEKDMVSYGAMMNGYTINNEPMRCFEVFEQMKQEDMILNENVCISLIGACAQVGMMSRCTSIVSQIPSHLCNKQNINSSLINMWGRVGSIENAQQIFQSISIPDVITYNSMINAFGLNGMSLEAVDLYREMPIVLRDEVSHISVLNACSHGGVLQSAHSIFSEISNKTEKIVTTMIDCLSRLFMFDEAQKLLKIHEKSNSPYIGMYMAILSGARNCRNATLSEEIYKKMKCLFPDQKDALISGSILLCNTYSSLGDHKQAENIRSNNNKELGYRVKPGLSWTEVDGELVYFHAHDQSRAGSKELLTEAQRISAELAEHGHKSDSTWITRPIGEYETVESVLCGHSERLAIAFNFMRQSKPTFIQVAKNLRVCGDCHEATKLIAKIRQCEIVVRDANRIHHFHTNGKCSCQDHF